MGSTLDSARPRRLWATRFALSALLALPVTVLLLLLMTRLILPGEQDPVVSQMIQQIEFLRAARPSDLVAIQVFERPPALDESPPDFELPDKPVVQQFSATEAIVPGADRSDFIDWWAEARKLTQESDDEALQRWLIEQGYEPYVSIMQGPVPITASVRARLPEDQGDRTGYLNTYGDLEFKISERCVAKTQVAARLDISDLAQKLPMRIVCKPAPRFKLELERDGKP